jgi:GNAT superfamily N-acetyltransferase
MFEAEVFDNNPSRWMEIKENIVSLEKEAFEEEPFTAETLEADFLDPQNIIVLLKGIESEEIIGFAYAKPSESETEDSPAKPGGTAWMWDTVIQKEYRGRGLLGVIMSVLEEELKTRGFKYLERNALVANNFAENISKYYKDRIIKTFSLDSRWGPQVFFRIKL